MNVLFILESFTSTVLRVNVFCITPYIMGYFQDNVKRETFPLTSKNKATLKLSLKKQFTDIQLEDLRNIY